MMEVAEEFDGDGGGGEAAAAAAAALGRGATPPDTPPPLAGLALGATVVEVVEEGAGRRVGRGEAKEGGRGGGGRDRSVGPPASGARRPRIEEKGGRDERESSWTSPQRGRHAEKIGQK